MSKDWETFWRDFQEKPLLSPLLHAYNNFMSIKRYDKFPFYVYPGSVEVSNFEDSVIKFIDYMVDAHELERRKVYFPMSFYNRANYVGRNFLWYSNDTMANCYYDDKLRQSEYDRLDSIMQVSQLKYYSAAFFTHFAVLSYLTFFFRYRRLNKMQVFGVGSLYYYGFSSVNNTLYKLCVDKNIINEARVMGLNQHVQPTGTLKARGFNYETRNYQ